LCHHFQNNEIITITITTYNTFFLSLKTKIMSILEKIQANDITNLRISEADHHEHLDNSLSKALEKIIPASSQSDLTLTSLDAFKAIPKASLSGPLARFPHSRKFILKMLC
jgi:hypothetical protein